MIAHKWLALLLGLLSFDSPARAQLNDWSSIENLAPETPISVVVRLRRDCTLITVTSSHLICDQQIGSQDRRVVLPRARVREVRLEQTDHNRLIAGAVIGGVAGGLIGFLVAARTADPEGRGYARAYAIPIGAFMGGAAGSHFHRHGAVVYRRP